MKIGLKNDMKNIKKVLWKENGCDMKKYVNKKTINELIKGNKIKS